MHYDDRDEENTKFPDDDIVIVKSMYQKHVFMQIVIQAEMLRTKVRQKILISYICHIKKKLEEAQKMTQAQLPAQTANL